MAAEFPLARAQEIVAREQGFPDWQALRSSWSDMPTHSKHHDGSSRMVAAYRKL